MSISTALQQHLSRLDTPGPVQQYAISAIFDAACQGTSSSSFSAPLSGPAEAAILQCLCLQDGQAAAVAAEKVIEAIFANKLATNVAQSLLLTALAVGSPSSATALTAALVSLWHFQLVKDATVRTAAISSIPWKSHVLSKALLASPFAGTELISSVCKILSRHAAVAVLAVAREKKTTAAKLSLGFTDVLNSLRPFLNFIFLNPIISKKYPQHATNLHSSLVRTVASPSAAPENQHAMLSLLCSFLPALQVQSTAQQLFVESCVADIMDLIEACETEPDISIIKDLVNALLSLCNDISSYSGNITPFITALATAFSYWPAAVLESARGGADTALRLTRFSVSPSVADSTGALSLLCSILLEKEGKGKETRDRHQDGQSMLAAAVSVQLAPVLAFGQVKNVKEWTSRALAAANKYTDGDGCGINITRDLGDGVSLLCMLWSNANTARCWLQSLESELSNLESSSTNTLASISPPTATLLLSLVHHREGAVANAAIDALFAAVHAAPLLGITALPVLIHKLHSTVEKCSFLIGDTKNSGNDKNIYQNTLASVLPTLYALPRLAVHPSAVAFIVRALQPLLAPPAPEFIQGVALRMLCEMWLTTGRGFPHLRTALLSYSSPAGGRRNALTPHMAEDPVLRRAWAASLADVCAQDGERAKDLIHSITECLQNSSSSGAAPEVQAAGLECVAELCESDILDFYKAWKIVKPLVPALPCHPIAAAAWLRLLASGGLDAAVYPEISRGIFNALWTAAQKHDVAIVRAQACASLAAYDFMQLEESDILTLEMFEIAALLKDNTDLTTKLTRLETGKSVDYLSKDQQRHNPLLHLSGACEELVVHVLRYEHTTRRRQQQQRGVVGKGSSSKETTSRKTVLKDGGRSGRFPWSNRTRALGASGAAGAASSAQGVTHKLVSVFPKALLGGGGRDPKEFLRRIPDVTPFAVLLLWSPPPPPSTSSSLQKSAAKHAAAGYASVFSEVCKQSDAGFSGVYNSSEVFAEWASFIKRWVSAAKDAAGAAASSAAVVSPSERTFAGAQAVWQVIKSTLDGSGNNTSTSMNVTVASTAACAAAALASSVHPQPFKPIVEQVFAALTQHAQHDFNGIYIQAAACTALGHCTDAARSILGLPALSAALGVLQRHLADPDAPSAVRAGSARGLSLAAKQLATRVNSSVQNVKTLLESLVVSLLGIAGSQFSQESRQEILSAAAAAAAAAGGDGDFQTFSFPSSSENHLPEEVVDSVFVAVAESLPAMLAVGLPTSLLCVLRNAATDLLFGTISSTRTAAVHGLCELMRASTLIGFKFNVVTSAQVLDTLDIFKEMVQTGNPLPPHSPDKNKNKFGIGGGDGAGIVRVQNGKVAGAAALALGSIIPSLIKEGFVFPSTAISTKAGTVQGGSVSSSNTFFLESLVALAKESGTSKTMSARAAAKQGAAGGIAALLQGKAQQQYGGGEDVVVVFSETEKQALDVLESLSLKDEDVRARRGCARALAELCWSARHGGKSLLQLPDEISAAATNIPSINATTSNMNVAKGVASLPENSALRYLCETIDYGCWPEIYDDDEKEKVNDKGSVANETNQGSKGENQNVVEQSIPLTSDQAAAVLHCLAATPRLPVMDWSAVCRRLLRAHPGSAAVQKGIVLLFSSHASVSQALQMYAFISEDIFGQPGFTVWHPEAQHAVLEELARLLAAMPDAEAISVLRMLCEKMCPDISNITSSSNAITTSGNLGTTKVEVAQWQAALLQGLTATARTAAKQGGNTEMGNNNDNDHIIGSVAQSAWECAMHAVLPKLPVPTLWPLDLKLSTLQYYIQIESSSTGKTRDISSDHDTATAAKSNLSLITMKPWTFLLECALASPSPAALDTLCCQEAQKSSGTLFAKNPIHWTWLSAALVANNAVDLRGLQQPRNYTIHSDSGGAGGVSSGALGTKSNFKNSYDTTTITTTPDDVVLLIVARALGASPRATVPQKQQWIMDVLHAAEICTAPAAAVKLAACATVALASSTSTGASNLSSDITTNKSVGTAQHAMVSCFGKNHAVLIDCNIALNELPRSLRYLAESVEPCPVALVTSVVVALAKLAQTIEGKEENVGGGVRDDVVLGKKERIKELQKQCCWAVRHALPADTWVELYTKVEKRDGEM